MLNYMFIILTVMHANLLSLKDPTAQLVYVVIATWA